MTDGQSPLATLVLSIDVPEQHEDASNKQTTKELFRMLQSRGIPATWAAPNPGQLSLLPQLMAVGTGHDLALLGDHSWVGAQAGRTKFARELAARVESAREQHVRLSAIAVRDAELTEHLDLLVKHRISLIRGPIVGGSRTGRPSPQSLRFGVWHSPVSAVLPCGSWSLLGQTWSARQILRRAIRNMGIVHIVIDAEPVLASRDILRQVEDVLTYAHRQCQRGLLKLSNMSRLVARLAPKRRTVPPRSILRAA